MLQLIGDLTAIVVGLCLQLGPVPHSCHKDTSTSGLGWQEVAVNAQFSRHMNYEAACLSSVRDAEAGGSNPPFPTREVAVQRVWPVAGQGQREAITPRLARATGRHREAPRGPDCCEPLEVAKSGSQSAFSEGSPTLLGPHWPKGAAED
jgi:hypothetical protein